MMNIQCMCQKIVEKLKINLADGARGGDGEGDLQEPQQHGSQPLQEGHHMVQGKHYRYKKDKTDKKV